MRFFTPEILDNPYPLYKQWRVHHPIWQDEETGAWILSRFDDVRHVSNIRVISHQKRWVGRNWRIAASDR